MANIKNVHTFTAINCSAFLEFWNSWQNKMFAHKEQTMQGLPGLLLKIKGFNEVGSSLFYWS